MHMARRYADYEPAHLIRAARLARLPGVKRAEVCERFDLSVGMLRRAMKEYAMQAIPAPRDIVLHALTQGGVKRSGKLGNLDSLAGYVDYVNHDGCDAREVRRLLTEIEENGVLSVKGDEWRLRGEWP